LVLPAGMVISGGEDITNEVLKKIKWRKKKTSMRSRLVIFGYVIVLCQFRNPFMGCKIIWGKYFRLANFVCSAHL
jgi:hypothetical protein